MFRQLIVGKAHDDEENGQESESAKLDGLATNCIDCGNCDPVSRNSAGKNDDQVSNCGVQEELVG